MGRKLSPEKQKAEREKFKWEQAVREVKFCPEPTYEFNINMIQTYTVTYEINGQGVQPENLTGLLALPAEFPVLEAEGYTFGGWFTDETLQTPAVAGTKIESNITLYAKWTENTYTIAFNANGGTGTMASMTGVKYTESKVLTTNTFTRAGYTLVGWNTKADGSGTNYNDGATVS